MALERCLCRANILVPANYEARGGTLISHTRVNCKESGVFCAHVLCQRLRMMVLHTRPALDDDKTKTANVVFARVAHLKTRNHKKEVAHGRLDTTDELCDIGAVKRALLHCGVLPFTATTQPRFISCPCPSSSYLLQMSKRQEQRASHRRSVPRSQRHPGCRRLSWPSFFLSAVDSNSCPS